MTVGGASLSIGRVRVTACVTMESEEVDVALLDAGDGQVTCRVRTGSEAGVLATSREAVLRGFPSREAGGWPRELEERFGGRTYTIDDVFLDERRRLVARLAERALEGPPGATALIETAGRRLLGELRLAEGAIPSDLAGVAHRFLARAAREELAQLAGGSPVAGSTQKLRELLAEARSLGISLGLPAAEVTESIRSALERVLEVLRAGVTASATADAVALLAVGHVLDAPVDLWAAQNAATGLWHRGSPEDRQALAPLMSALGFAPGVLAGRRDH